MFAVILNSLLLLSLLYLVVSLLIHGKRVQITGYSEIGVSPITRGDLIMACVLTGYLAVLFFFSNMGSQELPGHILKNDFLLILSFAVGQTLVVFPVLPILVRFLAYRSHRPLCGWTSQLNIRNLLLLPVLVVAALALLSFIQDASGFASFLNKATGSPVEQPVVSWLREGSTAVKCTIIFGMIIVAPISEELIFRGFLYNVFKKYAGATSSMIFTALLFSSIHSNIGMFLHFFLIGVSFVWLYEKTKTLWSAIIAHMIYNSVSIIVILIFP